MEKIEESARQTDTWQAWQQAVAEVPPTPVLADALARRRFDLMQRFAEWYQRLQRRPRAERRRVQRRFGLSLAGVALILAMHGAPANAAGPAAAITVTNGTSTIANGDGCSLPEAMINANAGNQSGSTDCATGTAGPDTITLATNVTLTTSNNATNGLPVVTSAITIEGNGNTISRQSTSSFRILAVSSGGNLTLNSATVSGGHAGGMYPSSSGGGIYVNSGIVTISSSTISGNTASEGGGGIFAVSASLAVSNSTISGNTGAISGAGIHAESTTVSISNSTLSGNRGSRYGSGLYAKTATVTVLDSTFSGNTANMNGGGIYAKSATVTVTNSALSSNVASIARGGGILAVSTSLVVSNSIISGNRANGTAGIYARLATVTVLNSTFSGNSASYAGGGFGTYSATVTLSKSTFSGNTAGLGGGIFAGSAATVAVTNSTVSGNSGRLGGGGVYAHNATVTMSNSTVAGNWANGSGSGIRRVGGEVTILSSIVAQQASSGDCSTTLTSGGYNIESGTSCGFNQTGDLQNVSSGSLALGALASNGGPTQTMALGLTSVAVDRIPVDALEANGCGVTVITDQRGLPRASGATSGGPRCDVGAFEVQVPLAVTLASFDAQAMVDRIQLTWETVSEVNNAGFNLYRSASPAAPAALLAFVPSHAPGSTQGASYSYEDTEVSAGQTWYYWLEDVDLNGATSLHGPVSATFQAPTAVTLDALEAQAANPGSVTPWSALAAALIAAAGVLGVRRRSRAR